MNLNARELAERLRMKYSNLDATNFNVLDFLGPIGSPLDALMYARLFWPEFVEVDGMVFRKETMEDRDDRDRLAQALGRLGNPCEIEKSFNLVEVPSGLFSRAIGESTEQEDRLICVLLCEMWCACLRMTYPARSFDVQIWEPERTGGEIGVVFFQRTLG